MTRFLSAPVNASGEILTVTASRLHISTGSFMMDTPGTSAGPGYRAERAPSLPRGLFAYQLNGAVSDTVQLIQVMQPLRPLLVIEKFRAKTHARHRRSQIMSSGRNQPHPA